MKQTGGIFEFLGYRIDKTKATLSFDYGLKKGTDKYMFCETLYFPKKGFLENKLDENLQKNILDGLHLVLGLSYWKIYCPSKIILNNIKLSKQQAEFWNLVYTEGMGEFFYKNKIDYRGLVNFSYDDKYKPKAIKTKMQDRLLVMNGGGKDSIVAMELLKKIAKDFTVFSVNEAEIQKEVAALVGGKKIVVKRELDKKLLEFRNKPDAYNGHVPVSLQWAFIGLFTAVIYDYRYIISANENSASQGNIEYLGRWVNHQWSKSFLAEKMFSNYVKEYIATDVLYFSILRPLSEIKIVEIFSKYKKYFKTFSSCNANFKIKDDLVGKRWCGHCPKCVFVFTMLSAYLSKKELLDIFGKSLFEDKKLLPTFEELLGLKRIKPFECVGTAEEMKLALRKTYLKNEFGDAGVIKFFEKVGLFEKIDQIGLSKKLLGFSEENNIPEKFLAMIKKTSIELDDFEDRRKILILGYGLEGRASLKFLKKLYPKKEYIIADQKLDKNYLKRQEDCDFAIKSPGINKNLVKIPYTTATNIFFSQIKNITIGVTGSKGKSTTASLIYAILKEAGKKVRLIGNIGSPMLEVLLKPIDENEIFIIELSSYQLDDLKYSPHISVVINLFPEHMNYHGSVEKYYAAKKNIINFQNREDHFVYNGKNKELKKWAKKTNTDDFSKINLANIKASLLGAHNMENAKAAIAVANILKIPKRIIKKGVESFKNLPHRLEFVGEFKGIKFYDDANATIPEATIEAIKTLSDVDTIFLGGLNRGYDFSGLAIEIDKSKIRNIVFFPDSGTEIEKILLQKSNKKYTTIHTKNMKEAVNFAFLNTKIGKICLLSMASPSYSLWKNFEEKGDEFQGIVKSFK
ncbi:MAG: UDP-N-acetylmuramoyl-L-alanine--D-glutamate ligase [Candidatus Moraniibacteriota bacterium]